MAEWIDAKPKNKAAAWLEERLPVIGLVNNVVGVDTPTPRNLNYWWNFGSLAGLMLVVQIISGIVLAMHYTPNTLMAFDSVERIMRDVNYGWLIRYMHANGASFFFIAVYIHILRGLYYGSYKAPREVLWMLGLVIFLLMMATAFMGYVLPWGQMSFWGATVITNLFSAIPVVGDSIVTLLWGGFSVDNPTLNRFFSLHYLLPFVIAGVVILHIWAKKVSDSGNPLGIDVKSSADQIPFHPFYTVKDAFGAAVFFAIFATFLFYMPNALGHPDNYIPADPLVTPGSIVPEWYFLPFYAILRSITFDIGIPFTDVVIIPAKLLGVIAMFAAILVLFFLPWLDRSKVRSGKFRPMFRWFFWFLVIDMVVLTIVGGKKPEGIWPVIGLIGTAYYFAHFLVVLPLLAKFEKTLPLPESIANPVVKAAE
ncbi:MULTISPECIES: cytochrome b [Kordiimonas]|jgi:quinol-cytochrome oxidoreductase complex cytochrome b subunit|uniref:Cytochrome b n=1 Tax=Kordiimonas lacus TaxID=637679 RepID=A0A1G7DCE3_9PROT|nr:MULTISPECIES: cytochrome b N-terminal domain-containing protein [Kordiimonas]SDE48626.1 ubiquinol-cytochrome c reductase cytochrome b subunit [Kordiimonas lacus]